MVLCTPTIDSYNCSVTLGEYIISYLQNTTNNTGVGYVHIPFQHLTNTAFPPLLL